LRLRSGSQRFYEGLIGFSFPMMFSGVAEVCEWYDDETERFNIKVDVRNSIWGRLFGYRGSFEVEWVPCSPEEVPEHVKPIREEQRE